MIQTPSLVQSSFTKYTLKMLFIFQRRIDENFEKIKAMRAVNTLPGNSSKGFGKAHFLGGRVFGASGGTPEQQHNYHTIAGGGSGGAGYSNRTAANGRAGGGNGVGGVGGRAGGMNGGGTIANGHATMVRDRPPSYWSAMNGNT